MPDFIYENSFSYKFVYPHIHTRKTKSLITKMGITYFTVQSFKQFLYHKSISLTQQTDWSYKFVGPNLENREALKVITLLYTCIVSAVAVFKWIYGWSRIYASNTSMHGRAFVYLCSSLITFPALCLFLIHRLVSTALLAPPASLTENVSQKSFLTFRLQYTVCS
jgi:hypothetical protein